MYFNRKALHSFMVGFFCFMSNYIMAQDQKLADSLAIIYKQGDISDSAKLKLLRKLSFNEVIDLQLALRYADELIALAQKQDYPFYVLQGYLQKGYKKWTLGDLNQALDAFIMAIDASKKAGSISGEGAAYCAIADIYSLLENHSNAMLYYNKAITILRLSDRSKDSIALASAILNAGDEYLTYQDYDSALMYFTESGVIFEEVNYPIGKAYNLGNIGMVYANIGKDSLAEQNINEAILILEESGDYYPVCFYLISMSEIYMKRGDLNSALSYASRSLKLAKQYQLKQQISDANLKLSELYEKAGNADESLIHYKNYIVYRDSVNNVETVQKIADQRTEFEVNLREKEIDLLEERQLLNKIYIITAIILLVMAVVVLLYFRQRLANAGLIAAQKQKQHAEKITRLLNAQETKALQSMVKGQESERKRLAQDLHNHFGSLLATIKININGIDEEAIPNHQTLTTLVDQACSDIRNMSHSLNMGISDNFGLVPALKELTTHLQHANGLEVAFSASMCHEELGAENEIIIYRIVQELVSNVLKHADASKMSILLTCFDEDNLVNIMVQDNGKGFDTSDQDSEKDRSGIGLKSLIAMIHDLHGEIAFDSNPSSGTTVSIDLPISNDILRH